VTAKQQNAYPGLADYGDIMTLEEVAQYLRVSKPTVSRTARLGGLVILELSPQCRGVRKADLVEYLDHQAQRARQRADQRPRAPAH